jgi:hypothetical protein
MSQTKEEFIKQLRQYKTQLIKKIELLEEAEEETEVNQRKVRELDEKFWELSEDIRLFKNPKVYIEDLASERRFLLKKAAEEDDTEKSEELINKARLVKERLDRAIRYFNTLPPISEESVKKIETLTKQMKELAQTRRQAVNDLNNIVEVTSTVLDVIATIIPLAAAFV